MQTLEFFYQAPLKAVKFIDRKFSITAPKTLIIASEASGKTSLIYEHLKSFKSEERLYINFADIRVDPTEILQNLPAFLHANPAIKILAADNISSQEEASQISLIAQNLPNCIIATDQKNINLQGFSRLILGLLDYEEFIAFFPKNFDEAQLFSHYLLHGKSPSSAFLDPNDVTQILQNRLKSQLSQNNLQIIKECAALVGQNFSAHEIYGTLKQRMKISKDSVYGGISELENRGFIAYAAKFGEPNAAKRLYFCDFALRNALNLKKDFARLFANVVFCELDKFSEPIFYTKEFDFFLAKRKIALLCIPFSDSDLIFLKFKKLHANLKNLGINRLQVISVANSGELVIQGIKCEILPFTRWALGID